MKSYKLKNGKILEWLAQNAIIEAGGYATGDGGRGREFIGTTYEVAGFQHTNETGDNATYTILDSNGGVHRLGRGEMLFDATVNRDVKDCDWLLDLQAVSLKGGDSRDFAAGEALRITYNAVKEGLPLWVWCLEGQSPDAGVTITQGVPYMLDERKVNITVRRINITPLLQDVMSRDEDWQMGKRNGRCAFVREMKQGKYTYPRLRIVWKSVPAKYWMDAKPIPLAEALTPVTLDEAVERASA